MRQKCRNKVVYPCPSDIINLAVLMTAPSQGKEGRKEGGGKQCFFCARLCLCLPSSYVPELTVATVFQLLIDGGESMVLHSVHAVLRGD